MAEMPPDFWSWWMEVESDVKRMAKRYTTSPETAEDLMMDMAFVAIRKFPNFVREQHFKGWVLQRTKWLALDYLRRESKQLPLDKTAAESIAHEQRQEKDVAVAELLQAVSKLPEQQERVIRGLLAGKSSSDLATELGISERTVRSLKRYARRRLVTLLGEEEEK